MMRGLLLFSFVVIAGEQALADATKTPNVVLIYQNQLYHLATDPAEARNVWAEQPEIVKRLLAALEKTQKASRSRP